MWDRERRTLLLLITGDKRRKVMYRRDIRSWPTAEGKTLCCFGFAGKSHNDTHFCSSPYLATISVYKIYYKLYAVRTQLHFAVLLQYKVLDVDDRSSLIETSGHCWVWSAGLREPEETIVF